MHRPKHHRHHHHHKHHHHRHHHHNHESSNTSCSSESNSCNVPCVVPPPRLGGCCFDGICSIQEERDCLLSGGAFAGVGTRCWEIKCPGNPVGACCLPRSNCALSSEQNCENMGGLWMGPYSSCQQCNPSVAAAYDLPLSLLGRPTPFQWQQQQQPFVNPALANAGPCGLPNGLGRPCQPADAGFATQLPQSVDVNYKFYSGGLPTQPTPPACNNFPPSINQIGSTPWWPF